MREILFRGKRIDNGEWVFGDLLTSKSGKKTLTYFVLPTHATAFDEYEEVKGESVGQFSGLLDKNGKKVFEGDVCLIHFDITQVENYIYIGLSEEEKENQSRQFLVESPLFNSQPELNAPDIEIIGTIHDKTA